MRFDYAHSFDYLGGFLGSDITEEKEAKRRKLGTVDMDRPDEPSDEVCAAHSAGGLDLSGIFPQDFVKF